MGKIITVNLIWFVKNVQLKIQTNMKHMTKKPVREVHSI